MDRRDVERGYDSKKQRNVQERKYSEIVALKRYNNWVKACLIRKYIPEHSRVLDFCGGKGGDYIKFNQNSVRSVLTCDISGESLKDAEKRYKEREPAFRFNLKTIKEDCFSSELLNKIPSNSSFEAVSCQFAIHYSFETKERAYQAVFNLTKYLRKGGLFVGTTVNAYRVVKKLRTVPGNKFGNELFTIRFDEQFDKENIPTYGAKYYFELKDAIDNLPEYLIPFCEFQKICEEHGLKLIGFWDFHQFYREWIKFQEYNELLDKMGKIDYMPNNQWEIISYYCAFVFQKVR
ncbi:hypothetical protein ENUP19_0169G0011 [Entamoeba nuttalli]|uniref:mRNA (guanine-N(7))-methyltransferase n=2 Tax=Entamoeba nuttalli TaxID=412467 RepID=K2GB25_ENTNP|nr:mRNA capping methyltransferase, putative [Entamoeba nuttalli P19]EKE39681.1 mRNA capping methyltransferase, putative [Entamoeba nuttalli P19]|eukprot:XP_008857983.1 mRNA capping methyltransferase, putative [Entamoeba nuttalli P19]